jgi:hypothetical protein
LEQGAHYVVRASSKRPPRGTSSPSRIAYSSPSKEELDNYRGSHVKSGVGTRTGGHQAASAPQNSKIPSLNAPVWLDGAHKATFLCAMTDEKRAPLALLRVDDSKARAYFDSRASSNGEVTRFSPSRTVVSHDVKAQIESVPKSQLFLVNIDRAKLTDALVTGPKARKKLDLDSIKTPPSPEPTGSAPAATHRRVPTFSHVATSLGQRLTQALSWRQTPPQGQTPPSLHNPAAGLQKGRKLQLGDFPGTRGATISLGDSLLLDSKLKIPVQFLDVLGSTFDTDNSILVCPANATAGAQLESLTERANDKFKLAKWDGRLKDLKHDVASIVGSTRAKTLYMVNVSQIPSFSAQPQGFAQATLTTSPSSNMPPSAATTTRAPASSTNANSASSSVRRLDSSIESPGDADLQPVDDDAPSDRRFSDSTSTMRDRKYSLNGTRVYPTPSEHRESLVIPESASDPFTVRVAVADDKKAASSPSSISSPEVDPLADGTQLDGSNAFSSQGGSLAKGLAGKEVRINNSINGQLVDDKALMSQRRSATGILVRPVDANSQDRLQLVGRIMSAKKGHKEVIYEVDLAQQDVLLSTRVTSDPDEDFAWRIGASINQRPLTPGVRLTTSMLKLPAMARPDCRLHVGAELEVGFRNQTFDAEFVRVAPGGHLCLKRSADGRIPLETIRQVSIEDAIVGPDEFVVDPDTLWVTVKSNPIPTS